MARNGFSTSNFLRATTAPITAYPFTVAAWFNPSSLTDANDSGCIVGQFDNSGPTIRWLMYPGLGGDGHLRLFVQGAGANTLLEVGSVTMTAGNWYLAIASLVGNSTRKLWLGEPDGTITAHTTESDPSKSISFQSAWNDRFSIGQWDDSTAALGLNASVSRVGAWDVELSADSRTALAHARAFQRVQPGDLQSRWELNGTGDVKDLVGSSDLAEQGTVTDAESNMVVMPEPWMVNTPPAVGGGSTIPVFHHHYNQMRAA